MAQTQSKFLCPVDGCDKHLKTMNVRHFRGVHGCTPREWVDEHLGDRVRALYRSGLGTYVIADRYEWLTKDMVSELVDLRDFETANSEHNVNQRIGGKRRLSRQQKGASNSNWNPDSEVVMPDTSCPRCGRSLRKRAPNFASNMKRREIGDPSDRFVCLGCRESFSEDEVVEEPDTNLQMKKWMGVE